MIHVSGGVFANPIVSHFLQFFLEVYRFQWIVALVSVASLWPVSFAASSRELRLSSMHTVDFHSPW